MVREVGIETVYMACRGIVVASLPCETSVVINHVESDVSCEVGPVMVILVGGGGCTVVRSSFE